MSYEIKLPELGENDTSGLVVGILVEVGDQIKVEESLIEVEISKATIEIPSEVDGVVKEILVQENDEIETGSSIMIIETEVSAKPNSPAVNQELVDQSEELEQTISLSSNNVSSQIEKKEPIIPAAPSVRRLAREHGLDLSIIEGSGKYGRITKQDIIGLSPARRLEKDYQPRSSTPALESNRQKMNNIRLATAKGMSKSWAEVPHVTNFDKANMTRLTAIRQKHGSAITKGKLTVTALMIKIVSVALQKFPQFNSQLDLENKEIIYHQDINIGIAVDTTQGLLVPVIKDVQKKIYFKFLRN